MSRILHWLLGRLPIMKQLNGYKTEIGFVMWLLSFVLLGLTEASAFFPEMQGLVDAHEALSNLYLSMGQTLEKIGLGVMAVGVGHKAVKEKINES